MTKVKHIQLKAPEIYRVDYLAGIKELIVTFKNGECYVYYDVEPKNYKKFINLAKSNANKALNLFIKSKHLFTKLNKDEQ